MGRAVNELYTIYRINYSVGTGMKNLESVFYQLMNTIVTRKDDPKKGSYTCQLFEAGLPKIGAKVLEEAAEVVEAAAENGEAGREHLVYEAADVVYHLFVLLASQGVKLEEIEAELARRFGISGLEEKATRPK